MHTAQPPLARELMAILAQSGGQLLSHPAAYPAFPADRLNRRVLVMQKRTSAM
jgi:hypothetical protein